jgi:hypothetical protein
VTHVARHNGGTSGEWGPLFALQRINAIRSIAIANMEVHFNIHQLTHSLIHSFTFFHPSLATLDTLLKQFPTMACPFYFETQRDDQCGRHMCNMILGHSRFHLCHAYGCPESPQWSISKMLESKLSNAFAYLRRCCLFAH